MNDQEIKKQGDLPGASTETSLDEEAGQSIDGIRDESGREAKDVLEIEIERPSLETMDEISPVLESFVNETYKPIDDPSYTIDDDLELNVNKAKRLISQSRFYIARNEGKIVGYVGVIKQGRKPDEPERDVFEITQSYTLPEFRKHGVSKRLKAALKEDLYREFPDALLMAGSENSHVIKNLIEIGYEEVDDPDMIYQIIISREDLEESDYPLMRAWIDTKAKDPNFKFFMFDPQKQKKE